MFQAIWEALTTAPYRPDFWINLLAAGAFAVAVYVAFTVVPNAYRSATTKVNQLGSSISQSFREESQRLKEIGALNPQGFQYICELYRINKQSSISGSTTLILILLMLYVSTGFPYGMVSHFPFFQMVLLFMFTFILVLYFINDSRNLIKSFMLSDAIYSSPHNPENILKKLKEEEQKQKDAPKQLTEESIPEPDPVLAARQAKLKSLLPRPDAQKGD